MSPASDAGAKLITCILAKGKGLALLEALHRRKVLRTTLGTARAPFFFTKKNWTGLERTIHHSVEKDILTVVVDAAQADDVFDFIHESTRVAELYGGFMFMGPLAQASPFALPVGLPD